MNKQFGGKKLEYVPKFCIEGIGHVISRIRNDDLHRIASLKPNISKTLGDSSGSVPMEHL